MAAPGRSLIGIELEEFAGHNMGSTHALLAAMLRAADQVSDLIFSPGRPPQVGIHGEWIPIHGPSISILTADDTRRIAADVIGDNKQAITILREQGSCDISFGVPGVARFRANVFIQRGSCALVMRVIPTVIPTLNMLGLPEQLSRISDLRDGIVLVTGGRGSGKSSTLAALLNRINEERVCHIITVEDPIEFLHNHKRATVHQRELHSDTATFALGLRSALRQSPQVILVSEIHEAQTMATLLEAAETGQLVLSSMNTLDAAKTVERAIGMFAASEQASIRTRIAKAFRAIVSVRLIPRADEAGRVAAVEILNFTSEVRECVEQDPSLLAALMKRLQDSADGMTFDSEIETLIRNGVINLDSGLAFATSAADLRTRFAQ